MAHGGDLLDRLRAYLVAQGAVRLPGAAGAVAPLWLHPEGGAPAPGDKSGSENHADLMVSAFHSGGVAAPPYGSFWRRDTVDFWFRARKAPFAFAKEAELRDLLVADLGRRDWDMAGLRVIESVEWRPLQLTRAGGSGAQVGAPGHDFIWSVLFQYDA